MNDLLERMVKDAGFKVFGEKIVAADENSSGLATESVKRLIDIVREEEREACANVCDELRDEWARLKVGAKDGRYEMMEEAAAVCEAEIRERSNVGGNRLDD